MRSVNKVILIGNLTRDPEMRQTPNGQQVATFGLATNREWVTRDGMRHTSSEYHEIVAWSRLADICGKYLKKGKLVYIDGYLKTRSWDTPEGIKKFKTEIVIQDMIMLEKRPINATEEYIPEEGLETNNNVAAESGADEDEMSGDDLKAEAGFKTASASPHSAKSVRSSKRGDGLKPPPRESAPEREKDVAAPVGNGYKSSPTDIDADLGL